MGQICSKFYKGIYKYNTGTAITLRPITLEDNIANFVLKKSLLFWK